jgi:hypothetical protein
MESTKGVFQVLDEEQQQGSREEELQIRPAGIRPRVRPLYGRAYGK